MACADACADRAPTASRHARAIGRIDSMAGEAVEVPA
jgi:hypothetical protein